MARTGEGKDEDETRVRLVYMQGKESHRRFTWIPSQGTPVANAKEARLVNKPRVRGLRACVRCVDHCLHGVPNDEVNTASETSVSPARRR